MSAHRVPTTADAPYDFQLYAIDWERSVLHQRIRERIDAMVLSGLQKEVAGLLWCGLPPTAQSMQGIGYKEWLPVFNGEMSAEQAVESIVVNTRNYARRQLIWFRRDARIYWIPADKRDEAPKRIVSQYLEGLSWTLKH